MNDTNDQQERLKDIAWLAGIWEGEGNITIVCGSKNRYMPRASVINTDMILIEEIGAVLDRISVGHYFQLRRGGCDNNPRHADAKVITIAGIKRMRGFLEQLLPELRGKKKTVATAVLEFCERRLNGQGNLYTTHDLELVRQVRALNKKGPSESPEAIRRTE